MASGSCRYYLPEVVGEPSGLAADVDARIVRCRDQGVPDDRDIGPTTGIEELILDHVEVDDGVVDDVVVNPLDVRYGYAGFGRHALERGHDARGGDLVKRRHDPGGAVVPEITDP